MKTSLLVLASGSPGGPSCCGSWPCRSASKSPKSRTHRFRGSPRPARDLPGQRGGQGPGGRGPAPRCLGDRSGRRGRRGRPRARQAAFSSGSGRLSGLPFRPHPPGHHRRLPRCCAARRFRRSFAVTTSVTFHPLTPAAIAAYLRGVNPLDKAGAYAVQDDGERIIEALDGSLTNVVGLPLAALRDELARLPEGLRLRKARSGSRSGSGSRARSRARARA